MSKTTWIHVNQHAIRRNKKTGSCDPVLTIKDYTQNRKGQTAQIRAADGTILAEVLYSPETPLLSCGAHVAIRTTYAVTVSEESYDPTNTRYDPRTCLIAGDC